MAPLKIVIVGAGWGGQGCCQALAALDAGEAEIVCVDGKEAVDVGATWQFEIGKRAAPLAVPLEQSRAAPYLRRDTVESVDTAAKTVRLAGGASLPYDKLVLACRGGAATRRRRRPVVGALAGAAPSPTRRRSRV